MTKLPNKIIGDQIADELVTDAMTWFNADTAKLTVNECILFAQKLVKSLTLDNLKSVKPKDKSQMLAYIGKTLDQIARLTQFTQGKADTRTEVTIANLLPLLSEEEMVIFDKAIARAEGIAKAQDTGEVKLSVLH